MTHLKTCWQHIRRAPYEALGAIAVMTLNLFVTSVFFVSAVSFEQILRYFETRPQVTAFFKEGTELAEIETLKEKLLATGKVANVKYVSKEEALAIYKEEFKDDPLLVEMVTAKMLPASLEVSAEKLAALPEVAEMLKEESMVEEVIFQKDVVSSLTSATSALRKFGAILIAFAGLTAFLIILIIIGMKIAVRAKEIEILRLIGATSWYIGTPFLLEGIFYGAFGAFWAWLFTYILVLYATPFLVYFLAGIPLLVVSKGSFLPTPFMLLSLGGLILVGSLIGALGSLLSIKRYLH